MSFLKLFRYSVNNKTWNILRVFASDEKMDGTIVKVMDHAQLNRRKNGMPPVRKPVTSRRHLNY